MIKIKTKSEYLCHTMQSSSNKGQKPGKIKLQAAKVAYTYEELGVVVLKPIIDRIRFSFCPDEAFMKNQAVGIELQEYRDAVFKSLYADVKTETDFLSLADKSFPDEHEDGYSSFKMHYQPPGFARPIWIAINPKAKAFMVFDLYPWSITQAGMKEFHKWLEHTLVMPGSKVSYEKVLIASNIIHLEIAVDILGARPDDADVGAMQGGSPLPHKSCIWKSKSGRVETHYPKSSPGHAGKEKFYDKRQNEIDKGRPPMYEDFLHSRAEFVAVNTEFFKLSNLKDRFSRISVEVVDLEQFNYLTPEQKLFVRYVNSRDLAHGLELLEPERRAEFQDMYQSLVKSIWKPKVLWAMWPECLKQSNLLP